ncbi:unnamed protein product [Bursaphelenchus okinawaensis]|uniref:Uncharacterized protein n=1 Tax=Bursaphelenchus okinawaensis TaxID=465554 RepID=A0A811K330_9BILA|nr:unnamed protein product [Bursaphelenchus okinawaensis]CAG9090299.1 unnamed protein product [Bursaphelenchus okinawaensis]
MLRLASINSSYIIGKAKAKPEPTDKTKYVQHAHANEHAGPTQLQVDPNFIANVLSYLAKNPAQDEEMDLRPQNHKVLLVPSSN